jgi:hypothetical protein
VAFGWCTSRSDRTAGSCPARVPRASTAASSSCGALEDHIRKLRDGYTAIDDYTHDIDFAHDLVLLPELSAAAAKDDATHDVLWNQAAWCGHAIEP